MGREIVVDMGKEHAALIDHCGIVLIFDPTAPERNIGRAIRAGGGVQQRGQHGLGIVFEKDGDEKFTKLTRSGLILDAVKELEEDLDVKTNFAVLHARYGTNGDYGEYNLQPCTAVDGEGQEVYVVVNGEFAAVEEMRSKLLIPAPEGASDTYIFTKLLAQDTQGSWEDRIKNAIDNAEGFFSFAITVKENGEAASYIGRDKYGGKPLVLGRIGNGWIIASETHALDKIGAEIIRFINRNELLKIDRTGLTQIREGEGGSGNFCDFEWAYSMFPTSTAPIHVKNDDNANPERWKSVFGVRYQIGLALAEKYPINADLVIGVPDSGVPAGAGYAAGSNGVPFVPLIVRDHYDKNGRARTFMNDDQEQENMRRMVVGKLSLVQDRSLWKGRKVVVVDDSLLRGTVATAIVMAILEMGVDEVYWFSAYPMVRFPCHLGVSLRAGQRNLLIAARLNGNLDAIATEIGSRSVTYVSNEGFIQARLGDKDLVIPEDPEDIFLVNGGCGGCVTGRYPVSQDGVVYKVKT